MPGTCSSRAPDTRKHGLLAPSMRVAFSNSAATSSMAALSRTMSPLFLSGEFGKVISPKLRHCRSGHPSIRAALGGAGTPEVAVAALLCPTSSSDTRPQTSGTAPAQAPRSHANKPRPCTDSPLFRASASAAAVAAARAARAAPTPGNRSAPPLGFDRGAASDSSLPLLFFSRISCFLRTWSAGLSVSTKARCNSSAALPRAPPSLPGGSGASWCTDGATAAIPLAPSHPLMSPHPSDAKIARAPPNGAPKVGIVRSRWSRLAAAAACWARARAAAQFSWRIRTPGAKIPRW